ncbi:MAG: Error-prone repair protein ImuA [Flavobacterium sp.]|nr:MAG: Error-prone repair protein ImuA [Flavobacterium sp.]
MKIARQLQAKINTMQGLGKSCNDLKTNILTPFASAFTGKIFPTGAIHEFISYEQANAASTNGFITSVISKLMKTGGLCLWIAGTKKVFPHALKHFGLEPDRVIFVNVQSPKDALWIIEEALKCEALTAVIGEVKELSFTDSRRLQLAVEKSGVTGFIHRYCPHSENAVACTTRWKITALPSLIEHNLPGVGYSAWEVQLLKVRNGRPHSWNISWQEKSFVEMTDKHLAVKLLNERPTG